VREQTKARPGGCETSAARTHGLNVGAVIAELDHIAQAVAAIRDQIVRAEKLVDLDPAIQAVDRMKARARDLGIVVGADGRVSLGEAARLVDRQTRTLSRWREEGRLPATMVSGRPRFAVADIADALAGEPDIR
jgi:hypothetical protein